MEYLCCYLFFLPFFQLQKNHVPGCFRFNVFLDKALMDETGIHGKDLLLFLLSKSLPKKTRWEPSQESTGVRRKGDERRIKKDEIHSMFFDPPERRQTSLLMLMIQTSKWNESMKVKQIHFFTQVFFAWDSVDRDEEQKMIPETFCDPRLDDRQQISCLLILLKNWKVF